MRAPRTPSQIALVLLLAGLAGCGGPKVLRPLTPSQDDWPTLGRTAGRTAEAHSEILPPLVRLWTADLSAGTGPVSPLFVDSLVMLGTLRGELLLFDLLTGKKTGSISAGDAIIGSPAIEGNVLFIGASNTAESILAYDLVAGRSLWRKGPGDIEGGLLVLDGRVFAGTTAGSFVCLDSRTGDELWRFELPGNRTHKGIRSAASSDSIRVFVGADDGVLYALSADSGRTLWTYHTGAPVVGAPAVAAGTVYAGNLAGMVVALETAGGAPRWSRSIGTGVFAPPLVTGDLVIAGTSGGAVTALRTSDGTVAWETPAGAPVGGGFAASGGFLFGGTLGREVIALRRSTGAIVWRDTVGGRIRSAAAVSRGRLAVACDDRTVLMYGEKTP